MCLQPYASTVRIMSDGSYPASPPVYDLLSSFRLKAPPGSCPMSKAHRLSFKYFPDRQDLTENVESCSPFITAHEGRPTLTARERYVECACLRGPGRCMKPTSHSLRRINTMVGRGNNQQNCQLRSRAQPAIVCLVLSSRAL